MLLLMVMILTRCFAIAGSFFQSGATFACYRLQPDRRASEAESQRILGPIDDPELLKLAYRSGCRMIFLGIEAENDDQLEEANKKLNLKHQSRLRMNPNLRKPKRRKPKQRSQSSLKTPPKKRLK